jgi:hypothetical protein
MEHHGDEAPPSSSTNHGPTRPSSASARRTLDPPSARCARALPRPHVPLLAPELHLSGSNGRPRFTRIATGETKRRRSSAAYSCSRSRDQHRLFVPPRSKPAPSQTPPSATMAYHLDSRPWRAVSPRMDAVDLIRQWWRARRCIG